MNDVSCFLGIFDLPYLPSYLPQSDTLLHKLIYQNQIRLDLPTYVPTKKSDVIGECSQRSHS